MNLQNISDINLSKEHKKAKNYYNVLVEQSFDWKRSNRHNLKQPIKEADDIMNRYAVEMHSRGLLFKGN